MTCQNCRDSTIKGCPYCEPPPRPSGYVIDKPAQKGWICPLCNNAKAPWVSQCDCNIPRSPVSVLEHD